MISYILTAITLFHIGKREGVRAYGLAWVPGFQDYVLGAIADRQDFDEQKPDRKFRIFMLVCGIVTVIGAVCLIGAFAGLTTGILKESSSQTVQPSAASIYNFDSESLSDLDKIKEKIGEYLNDLLTNKAFLAGISGLAALSIIIGLLFSARTALRWVCLYKLFDLCKPSTVMISLILSALFPGLIAAIVLICKKNYRNDMPEMAVYQQ